LDSPPLAASESACKSLCRRAYRAQTFLAQVHF
jgi:hypothetical protein